MKKVSNYFVLVLFLIVQIGIVFHIQAKDPIKAEQQLCSSWPNTYIVNNFTAHGDALLGIQSYYSISDMTFRGYKVTLSIKATSGCKYSWSKDYLEGDSQMSGNTFWEVPIPNTNSYEVTVSIESGCVYDHFLARNVKFIWKKTFKNTDNFPTASMGYPNKADCAVIKSSDDRLELISRYEDTGRISSSTARRLY